MKISPRVSFSACCGVSSCRPTAQWSLLRVTAAGKLFNVYLNGEKLFEAEDSTFTDGGKVGVWTKGDSVTYFDDLEIKKK